MPAPRNIPGAPCWVDLLTSDVPRARDFYCSLFGWEAEEPNPEFGGYFNFTRNAERIAGCMVQQVGSQQPDAWGVHLTTEDAQKTVDLAAANGGQVVVPPMQVGDLGTMAGVIDPTGAYVGAWQPAAHRGFAAVAEAGAPSWFELFTRDHPAAVSFYREVFGWDVKIAGDTDEFRYALQVDGEEQLAGIMDATAFLPDGAPAHWSVYFGSDNTDATLAKVVELGGSVVSPAEDTPYGRLAVAADPTGAVFKLVAPNDQMPAKS